MSDMDHNDYCRKEGELASVKTELTDLVNIVKKNGLQKQVTELNVVIPQLKDTVADLSNNVRELLDKDIAAMAERQLKLSAKQKLTAIVSGIIGAATVIVMIADMIINR